VKLVELRAWLPWAAVVLEDGGGGVVQAEGSGEFVCFQ